MPEGSVNPVPTDHGMVQLTCTMDLSCRKCTNTNFDWTAHLLTSLEVGMKSYLPRN